MQCRAATTNSTANDSIIGVSSVGDHPPLDISYPSSLGPSTSSHDKITRHIRAHEFPKDATKHASSSELEVIGFDAAFASLDEEDAKGERDSNHKHGVTQCQNPLLTPSPHARKREKIKALLRREKQRAKTNKPSVVDLDIEVVTDANGTVTTAEDTSSPRAQKREKIKALRREKQRAKTNKPSVVDLDIEVVSDADGAVTSEGNPANTNKRHAIVSVANDLERTHAQEGSTKRDSKQPLILI